jgi:nicotinamide-nucleotide amidase
MKVRSEVITIGDELLSGSIVDTNSSMIAAILMKIGVEVHRMTSIGDEPQGIMDILLEASRRSLLIIVTGGLGPTEDDRTARAAADAFGRPLTLHEPSLQSIREFFDRIGIEMTSNNERQAYLPEGSKVIVNPIGTAPGFALEVGESVLAFLPGVPRELERMLNDEVLPELRRRFSSGQVILSRTLRLFGVGEAKMDQILHGALDGLSGLSLASLPRYPENRLRLTARANGREEAERLIETAEARLRERVGRWVYGVDEQALESIVQELLRRRGKRLAVAESCTGGLIVNRLTDIPGSSDVLDRGVVSYSNMAKTDLLGVPEDTLNGPGPVSAETAEAMASGAREHSKTDLGLAATGIAGPNGGSDSTPVGTVFLGLSDETNTWSQHTRLRGGRTNVKTLAATIALDWLRRYLLGENPDEYQTPWKR